MSLEKIGFAEALSILLIILLSHLLLSLPMSIIVSQGSASLLNVIYISLLALVAIFLLNLLYKKFKGMDILDISEFLFGKNFKFIIGLIFVAYFLFVASLLLRSTSENLKIIYFPSTPIPFILFFLILSVAFLSRFRLNNIIRCNLIIVPLIIIALLIVVVLSSESFVLERVFPIFGHGIDNIFLDGSANIFGFANIIFLFFIMSMLKDYKQFKKLSVISVLISGLFIFLTVASVLLAFPSNIAAGSNIPVYLQTREITLGKFIQRSDALFVLIWILAILSYLSVVTGFTLRIFKKITNIQNSSAMCYSFVAVLYGISLLYSNVLQIKNISSGLYKYSFIILVLGICFTILIFANIKKVFKLSKGG